MFFRMASMCSQKMHLSIKEENSCNFSRSPIQPVGTKRFHKKLKVYHFATVMRGFLRIGSNRNLARLLKYWFSAGEHQMAPNTPNCDLTLGSPKFRKVCSADLYCAMSERSRQVIFRFGVVACRTRSLRTSQWRWAEVRLLIQFRTRSG